ncbi:MAG: hypothetical protein ACK5MZ_01325 [Aestuariibaculum sp.]
MEEKNKVSVFTACFPTKTELDAFVEEKFTENGDIYSNLLSDLQVGFINHQFQEILFTGKPINKPDLQDFSYIDNFVSHIEFSKITGNSLIFLYNFNYAISDNRPKKLNYIGAFNYR